MVRIAISTAFIAAVIGMASALSLDQHAPIRALVKKISTVTNSKNIVAHDNARLNHYFKKNPVEEFATGSAPVTNEVFSYIAEAKVGSQTFDLIVDTGSSNTWVGATTKFTGTEYTDSVSIGGTAATTQSIGVAKSSTGFTGTDGIVGFGPEELTEDTVNGVDEVPTFLQTLMSEGVISSNILGVSFAPLTGSSDESANGELTFGGVDESAYTGDITYTTRVTPYWGVSVSKFAFGSTSLGTTTASGIVDTGTTLFYVPTAVYTKFLTASKGKLDNTSGLVKFTTKPTSNFTFVIGGTTFTLTPAQYLIATAQYSNWGISGTSGFYTFIGDGGSEAPNTILGQSFLEFYYSVYDTDNNRVGLATAA
ncbi:aspartic peptidase domain-containing protein [Mycena alexandri]|uniref:Aspartic peptidase domain-containing protein n=1 Tax=Mycena alexandri TaxID=1745969 RepID=A0AAD6TLC1_9AGAR|nr:aspartic peptidase domain-containing protein [Mycena alexandri]